MGVFEKLKNALFEVEYVEVDEPEKKEKKKKKERKEQEVVRRLFYLEKEKKKLKN